MFCSIPCYVTRRISEALLYISALLNSVVAASAAKSADKLRDCGYVLIPGWAYSLSFMGQCEVGRFAVLKRWTPSFRQLSGQIKVKSGVIGQAASGCDGAG